MTRISSDKMGRLGERKFDDLCDLAGLAVSTLLPDMTGKDRYVEFPLVPVVGTLTYDTRPAPLACYVQIKTLLRNNRRFGMRLSAAERLAHETKPAFVVVLRVDDRNKFVDMYLIHIDGSVLAAILKRLRMEQAKNSQHLNRKTISFSISAGQKVDVAPNALRDALITAIGPDMLAYTARKHRQTKELGFDPVRFNVKIGFAPLKIEHFVDGLLGLVDLPVKKFEAFERRFGIALPASPVVAEAPDSDYHKLRLQPHPIDRCVITVRKSTSDEGAHLEGDAYCSIIPGMDVKFLKALIKTDLIDFTLYDKGLTIEFHGGEIAEKEYSLQTLRQTYHILSLFREGECLVTFKMHKSGREINLPLRLDNDGDLSWIDPLAKLICAADELRQLAGMEDYPVGVGSLIAEQFEIFKVHALFATGANADSIQFATESTKLSVEETPFIFISGVNIGKRVLAYALRGTIAPRNADNLIQWKSKKLEPLVIEQLSGDVNGQYRAFTEKIARVSGISTILQSTLTTNEKG